MAELDSAALAGALGGEGQERYLGVDAEERSGSRGLDGNLRQLLRAGEDDLAGGLVKGVGIVDVDGAVTHAVLFVVAVLILAEEDEGRGYEVRTLLGLHELEGGTDGVGGGVGSAAEQSVSLAELYEHRAEIIALGQSCAALLVGHLALAELDHLRDHLVHAFICSGVDDGGLANAEIALFGRSLDLGFVADQDDVHQVFLEKTVGRLEDTGVGAFGEDDGTTGGFQSVKQFCKHVITSKICAAFRRFYLCLSYNNYPPNATVFCKNAQQNGAQAVFPCASEDSFKFFREQRHCECVELAAIFPVCRKQCSCLRRQRRTSSVFAAGGGMKQLEAQMLLRVFEDRPGLGIRHADRHGRGAKRMQLLHLLQQNRDAGAEALFVREDPNRQDGSEILFHSVILT